MPKPYPGGDATLLRRAAIYSLRSAGAAGVGLGYAAAWPVVTQVFKSDWAVDWTGVVALVAGAALLAGLGGLLASLQALGKPSAAALRAE